MGYAHALRTAGATIIEYKETGSYQGTWGAVVDFNGQRSLVTGYYGSCSVCDAFQSQFDSYNRDEPVFDEETGKWYLNWCKDPEEEITKEDVDAITARQKQELVDFAMTYLNHPLTKEGIQTKIDYYNSQEDDWFSEEERELYDWAIKFFD